MSWQAVTWVLEQSDAELGSRLVLLSIASHANREGLSAFPSIDTLTIETRLSRREVIYCIQALEESGALHVDRGGGRGNPNCYSLPFVRQWVEKVQAKEGKYAKKETVQGLHPFKKVKGATKSLKGAIYDTKGCNDLEVKPEESNTLSQQPLEPSKARTVRASEVSLKSIPEPSKSKAQYLAERDRQLTALREKGFIQ